MPGGLDLESLYDEHAQALFAFLLNLTRNEEDTRDLPQTTVFAPATALEEQAFREALSAALADLPAVNARWSLGRLLAQVAIKTTLAVLLGVLISLAVTGQPLGWVMWLLGVFAASQSIVLSGLTALCWNRRAMRLKENPALPIGLLPARHRLARWALGFIYFVVLAVVTPLAMLVTVENVYGELAWRRERAPLVARGERLTIREILGPEIPAAENAGAAPIFQPFFDYRRGRSNQGPSGTSVCLVAGKAQGCAQCAKAAGEHGRMVRSLPQAGCRAVCGGIVPGRRIEVAPAGQSRPRCAGRPGRE